MQEPIFPASGNPVIPLSQIDADEKTLVTKPHDYFTPLYTAPVYRLTEEALSFLVSEASLREKFKKALQLRGLLRLRDS